MEAKASMSLLIGKALTPKAETSLSMEIDSLTRLMYSSGVQPFDLMVDSKMA